MDRPVKLRLSRTHLEAEAQSNGGLRGSWVGWLEEDVPDGQDTLPYHFVVVVRAAFPDLHRTTGMRRGLFWPGPKLVATRSSNEETRRDAAARTYNA